MGVISVFLKNKMQFDSEQDFRKQMKRKSTNGFMIHWELFTFNNEIKLSVQASISVNCKPKYNFFNPNNYTHFEVALLKNGIVYPTSVWKDFNKDWLEYWKDTQEKPVAGCVPAETIQDILVFISKNC